MSHFKLESISSRISNPQLRAANRIDPYWDGLWQMGSQAAWVSHDLAMRQHMSGLAKAPEWMRADPAQALARVKSQWAWANKLAILGALGSWRTLSAQQLATFTNNDKLRDIGHYVRDLFCAGIIDVGVFQNGLATTDLSSQATLIRPSRTQVVDQELIPNMTIPERAFMLGGNTWRTGGQFDRHNLLTAEFGLRVAEYLDPIRVVMGESQSTTDMFFGTGLGHPPVINADLTTADGVLIRKDGLRIALEITAHVTDAFEQKANRWARLISKHPMSDSGLVVLFIMAPHPDRKSVAPAEYAKRMRRDLGRVFAQHRGIPGDQVSDRMFVASWEDYFPAKGMASDHFMNLRAHKQITPSNWQPVSLLDDFETPFMSPHQQRFRAVIPAARATAAIPTFLRQGTVADVHKASFRRTTGSVLPPVPVPADPRHRKGYDGDNPRASGKRALYPARLQTPKTSHDPK